MRASEWANNLAKQIREKLPEDSELPDLIADLQRAERTLADMRRLLLSEVNGPMDGREYRLVQSRAANRSYNTDGLLMAFGGVQELPDLVARDVVRLSWQWMKLRREAERRDVTLAVAQHEIGDGDPEALVGEVWTTKFGVEPK